MADHTPGPWTTRDTRDHGTEVQAEHFDGRTIATVYPRGNWYLNGEGTDPVQEANARLIAAAPSMYEILKSLHADLARYSKMTEEVWSSGSIALGSMADDVHRVLQEARGEVARGNA